MCCIIQLHPCCSLLKPYTSAKPASINTSGKEGLKGEGDAPSLCWGSGRRDEICCYNFRHSFWFLGVLELKQNLANISEWLCLISSGCVYLLSSLVLLQHCNADSNITASEVERLQGLVRRTGTRLRFETCSSYLTLNLLICFPSFFDRNDSSFIFTAGTEECADSRRISSVRK